MSREGRIELGTGGGESGRPEGPADRRKRFRAMCTQQQFFSLHHPRYCCKFSHGARSSETLESLKLIDTLIDALPILLTSHYCPLRGAVVVMNTNCQAKPPSSVSPRILFPGVEVRSSSSSSAPCPRPPNPLLPPKGETPPPLLPRLLPAEKPPPKS